jgi:hypothetical protein
VQDSPTLLEARSTSIILSFATIIINLLLWIWISSWRRECLISRDSGQEDCFHNFTLRVHKGRAIQLWWINAMNTCRVGSDGTIILRTKISQGISSLNPISGKSSSTLSFRAKWSKALLVFTRRESQEKLSPRNTLSKQGSLHSFITSVKLVEIRLSLWVKNSFTRQVHNCLFRLCCGLLSNWKSRVRSRWIVSNKG